MSIQHCLFKRTAPARKVGTSALDILANIDAMQLAADGATKAEVFSVHEMKAIHARLTAHLTKASRSAGVFRTSQNWIGGNDYKSCGADFVPLRTEYVEPRLNDLCIAINDETLPPLVQAALVHAQGRREYPLRRHVRGGWLYAQMIPASEDSRRDSHQNRPTV